MHPMSTQIDKKATLRNVFTKTAEGYGKIAYFQAFGKHLAKVAEINKGNRVLDVACGRGASLFPAALAAGEQGEVIGIDLSDGMVKETAAVVQKRGIKNVQVMQMDAENLQFLENHFDVVICGFALQFFPNLDQGLAEFNRVLKPGGRVAVSTWAEYEDPRWAWYEDLITEFGAKVSLGTNSVETAAKVAPWFNKAGFVDIQTTSEKFETVYPTEEDYWNMCSSVSARAGLEKLEPAKLEELKSTVFGKMKSIKEPDGYHDILEALFTTATKPA